MIITPFVFLIVENLFSNPVIIINENQQEYPIGKYIEIFEDSSKEARIGDIINGKYDNHFKDSKIDIPNFGYKEAVYWIRFKIMDKSERKRFWLLYLDYPSIDNFYFYSPTENYQERITGDMHNLSVREFKYRNFIYKIDLDSDKFYYIKFDTEGSKQFPLKIMSYETFFEEVEFQNYFFGMYYGIVIIMLFYNLFIFYSIREISYFYYIVFLLGFLLAQIAIDGTTFQFLSSDTPKFWNRFLPIVMVFTIIMSLLFTKKFLILKSHSKLLNNLINLLLVYGVIAFILTCFVRYNTAIRIAISYQLVMPFVALGSGIFVFLKGFKAAKFFILAWTLLLVSTFILALRHSGFLPTNFLTLYSMKIGSAIEVMLLSLALADKINIMKEENRKIQEKALEEQKILTNSFARFVPEQLLYFLGKGIITEVNLGDAIQKEMTILFSDIRSFTTLSEGMTPNENFDFINSYMASMGPCIRKHNGFIDKYIGDAIMALFPENPSDAIDAAIEMLEELHKLNLKRKEKGFSPISIGIGIHTGSQMLGIIGEKERLEGTVISDVVNTASRLEGLTKAYSSSILVSRDVLEKVGHPEKYFYRKLDLVKVKGKNKGVEILEILNGNSERIITLKLKLKPVFEKGIEYYNQKEFEKAKGNFSEVLKSDSKDKASELYIERCNFYMKNGVSPDWDGIEKLDFK